jgi:hypothetical protein
MRIALVDLLWANNKWTTWGDGRSCELQLFGHTGVSHRCVSETLGWLNQIDRLFFCDQFDAQCLLQDVIQRTESEAVMSADCFIDV